MNVQVGLLLASAGIFFDTCLQYLVFLLLHCILVSIFMNICVHKAVQHVFFFY